MEALRIIVLAIALVGGLVIALAFIGMFQQHEPLHRQRDGRLDYEPDPEPEAEAAELPRARIHR